VAKTALNTVIKNPRVKARRRKFAYKALLREVGVARRVPPPSHPILNPPPLLLFFSAVVHGVPSPNHKPPRFPL
jgi:hypothetical protein